jgi:hypothetical protein
VKNVIQIAFSERGIFAIDSKMALYKQDPSRKAREDRKRSIYFIVHLLYFMIVNKYNFMKHFLTFVILFFSIVASAQEGTRSTDEKRLEAQGKIMLVPFEPKLYMSEIDLKINQQTKWGFEQIRENFRHQLDAQLKLKFQNTQPVISFYSDSAKMAKDLEYIYKSSNISYDLVDNKKAAKNAAANKPGIKNGQIVVEVNDDKKFMNTKIANNEVLPYLSKKYNTDYFVFVNELDIKKDLSTYDNVSDTYQREIVVHYTILDKSGKSIVAGISTSRFSSTVNDPKKITSLYFSQAAATIADKLELIIHPPVKETGKK